MAGLVKGDPLLFRKSVKLATVRILAFKPTNINTVRGQNRKLLESVYDVPNNQYDQLPS